MSKEKQIEEMAKVMCDRCKVIFDCTSTEMCSECTADAEALYNAGYRKQSEGEWIFKEYGEDTYTNLTRIYECSLCGRTIECLNEAVEPYCHCGAKMKGGAE